MAFRDVTIEPTFWSFLSRVWPMLWVSNMMARLASEAYIKGRTIDTLWMGTLSVVMVILMVVSMDKTRIKIRPKNKRR